MIPTWILGTTGAAVALSVIVLAACRSTNQGAGAPGEEPAPQPHEVLVLEDLGTGATSGITAAGLHVVRDQASLDALWKKHMRLQLPTPPAPEIDFEDSMVVAAFVGQKPTGGYSVRIEEIVRMPATANQPGRIVVRTSETLPDEDAMVTQMLTSPFHMVRVEKADGEGVLAAD
ncbi:hypothetical protein Poly30_20450 [Planctomycetes bacterium Poly30]|uniref:PrcB C-terminal domain-containing protein n=1 Tax=Saltatorellus ferox TaxID=2528018 RepID=A0A518ER72_9BACT|nr:hypothetical protein Poly30_20450 [Planctomycetes bacterium Poly30]